MKSISKQRGVTLLVTLVMLVVLTLLVVSAIRASTINLHVAGNMQMQEEATSSAQQAIEQVISTNFTENPVSSVVNVDVNNNNATDYVVNVATPDCKGSTSITNASLDMADANDAPCFSSSTASNAGIFFESGVPVAAVQSWCYSQKWDVSAHATATSGSGADTTVHQGVSLRVPAGTSC